MTVTSRRLARPWLLALALLAGVLLALSVDVARRGGPRLWLAGHGVAPPYSAQGEPIDVGGRSLYLDCRGHGAPTVVLEAGMGADSATWSAVHDDLATVTRTCAYDRAGRGRSEPRGLHTLADAAADLRAGLVTAGENAPYVLVGHSLGGAYMRVFAGSRPDEVVGLVMVDTFDPDLQSGAVHPLLGPLRPEYDSHLDGLRGLVARVESLDWAASEAQLRASSLTGIPIEVLVAPRYEPRLDEAANADIAAAWLAAYESLSPGRVRHTTAWGAGHDVHQDRPELVVESVRRLVERARGG